LQVFSLVRPVDLLQMSRANKVFRTVLKNKSSMFVWIAGFNNIPVIRKPFVP